MNETESNISFILLQLTTAEKVNQQSFFLFFLPFFLSSLCPLNIYKQANINPLIWLMVRNIISLDTYRSIILSGKWQQFSNFLYLIVINIIFVLPGGKSVWERVRERDKVVWNDKNIFGKGGEIKSVYILQYNGFKGRNTTFIEYTEQKRKEKNIYILML